MPRPYDTRWRPCIERVKMACMPGDKVATPPMTSLAVRKKRPVRRARGMYAKSPRRLAGMRRPLPEYLELPQVEGLLQHAHDERSRLLMLIQWRAGLRIAEALAVEAQDVALDIENPTLRVRNGKGNQDRIVPLHPTLRFALGVRLDYVKQSGLVVGVADRTASRWVMWAVEAAVAAGVLPPGRHVTSHTLRHSYARHLLAHGIPLNVLSRWLGHRSIDTTLIYLELLPDPTGSLAAIP